MSFPDRKKRRQTIRQKRGNRWPHPIYNVDFIEARRYENVRGELVERPLPGLNQGLVREEFSTC